MKEESQRNLKIKALKSKGLTYEQIGLIYNISRQRVERIINKKVGKYYPEKLKGGKNENI